MSFLRRLLRGKSSIETDPEEPFDEETAGFLSSSMELLAVMRGSGCDFAAPRQVTHLFFGDLPSLKRAAKALAHRNLQVLEVDGERLVIGETAALSEAWVQSMIPLMRQTAGEFELTYDGWDVEAANKQHERTN